MIIHSLEWEDVYPHLSPYHKVGRFSKGRDLFPGSFLWMVTCGVWRCDCHLCGTGPTRIKSHVKILRRRQRRTRSPPQESKVLQVCVPVWSTASFPSETERGTRLRGTGGTSTWCVVALALALRKSQKILWLPFSSLKYSPHQGAWHTIGTLYGFLHSALSTTSGSTRSSDPHFPEQNINQASRNLPNVILVRRVTRARIQILV